jgi:hypothetical protein
VKVLTQERKLLGARYGTLLLTDVCLVGAQDRLTYGMFHENRFEHFLRALTRCFVFAALLAQHRPGLF